MIRIRSILYKISFTLLFFGISSSANSQTLMGARGLALGQSTTSLSEYDWSIFSNPALLNTTTTNVGFYGLRNYGFAEITDMAAFGSMPTKYGVGAIGFHRYGDELFNEIRVRLGYKNEWEQLQFGLAVNYNHISFGGPYGSGGALGIDLGLAAQVSSELMIGAKATNINKPIYDFTGVNEDLNRDLSVGFSYKIEDKAVFLMDVFKDVRYPVSFRSGFEISVIENVKGRVGVTTEPLTYSFGLGYGKDFWAFNLAVQQHSVLGLSPGFDLIFKL